MEHNEYLEAIRNAEYMQTAMNLCMETMDSDDTEYDSKYDYYLNELCRYGEIVYGLTQSYYEDFGMYPKQDIVPNLKALQNLGYKMLSLNEIEELKQLVSEID